MEKYFLVNIQNTGDATPCSIVAYENENEARSAYHSTLASNYVSTSLVAFSVTLLDYNGFPILNEYKEIYPTEE